jgi:hypothetical protein
METTRISMLFKRSAMAVAVAIGLGSASVAGAYEGIPQSPAFENLLRAIDVVPPDAVALLKAFPDAQARLVGAAQNTERDMWARQRAISLLSFLPDDTTRRALAQLATDANADIRAASVYTLARTFGPVALQVHDDVVRVLDAALVDPSPEVRQKAVRGLRWVRDTRAVVLLDKAQGREDLKSLATATRAKRELRLKALK